MERMKVIRLFAVVFIFVTVVVGYSKPYWEEPSQTEPAPQLPQFGEADGFGLVMFYGSDIGGDLEPCG